MLDRKEVREKLRASSNEALYQVVLDEQNGPVIMRLIIVSGRSGSGKSTALDVLEDNGYYCIDNLPAGCCRNWPNALIHTEWHSRWWPCPSMHATCPATCRDSPNCSKSPQPGISSAMCCIWMPTKKPAQALFRNPSPPPAEQRQPFAGRSDPGETSCSAPSPTWPTSRSTPPT
jgi:hypothetical protein